VIEIFDEGDTEDGTAYIVMELLHGCSLAHLIAEGPMDACRALPIMIQIARGIARAHDLGVVHRDLKPENIYVSSREDGSDLTKLLDFGIARSRTDSRLTNAGELFGTPQYMAPERVSSGDAGPNVDLYALGVIFFEMMTAELPFDAPDITTFLIKHLKEPPARPRSKNPDIPEPLEALILQLLEKEPKRRPVDAHRVETDLCGLAVELGVPRGLSARALPPS
jgi:serine/threonine-protein kinase